MKIHSLDTEIYRNSGKKALCIRNFYETFTHRYEESLQYRIISDNSQITIER